VEGDKNASARRGFARNASLLSFDATGNLQTNLPLTFAYNRSINSRLPIHDATGRVVGTMTVFSSGPGKKDAQDPPAKKTPRTPTKTGSRSSSPTRPAQSGVSSSG